MEKMTDKTGCDFSEYAGDVPVMYPLCTLYVPFMGCEGEMLFVCLYPYCTLIVPFMVSGMGFGYLVGKP